jgi:hypothetical protein
MKKLITQSLIREVLSQYKKYKLSLSESHVVDAISFEIADQLRRNFIIEPNSKKYKSNKQHEEQHNNS